MDAPLQGSHKGPAWHYVPHSSAHEEEDSNIRARSSQLGDGSVEEQQSEDYDTASLSQGEKSGKKAHWKASSLRKWAHKKLVDLQTKVTDRRPSTSPHASPEASPPPFQQQQRRADEQTIQERDSSGHPESDFAQQPQRQHAGGLEPQEQVQLPKKSFSPMQQSLPSVVLHPITIQHTHPARKAGSIWATAKPSFAHAQGPQQPAQQPAQQPSQQLGQQPDQAQGSRFAASRYAIPAHERNSSSSSGSAVPTSSGLPGNSGLQRGPWLSNSSGGSSTAANRPAPVVLNPLGQALRSSGKNPLDCSLLTPVGAPPPGTHSPHPSQSSHPSHSPARSGRSTPGVHPSPPVSPPVTAQMQPRQAPANMPVQGGVLHPRHAPNSPPLTSPQHHRSQLAQEQQQQQQRLRPPQLSADPQHLQSTTSHNSAWQDNNSEDCSVQSSGFSESNWDMRSPLHSQFLDQGPPHGLGHAPMQPQTTATAFARHQPKISMAGLGDLLSGAIDSAGSIQEGRAREGLGQHHHHHHHSRTNSRGSNLSVLPGGFGSVQVPAGLENSVSREASLRSASVLGPSPLAAIGEEQQPLQQDPHQRQHSDHSMHSTQSTLTAHHEPEPGWTVAPNLMRMSSPFDPQPSGSSHPAWMHPNSHEPHLPQSMVPANQGSEAPSKPLTQVLPGPSASASQLQPISSLLGHTLSGDGQLSSSKGEAMNSSGSLRVPRQVTFLESSGPSQLVIPDEANNTDRWSASPLETGVGPVRRRVTSEVAPSSPGLSEDGPWRHSVTGDSVASIARAAFKEVGERRLLKPSASARSPRSQPFSIAPLSGRLGSSSMKASEESLPMLPKPLPPPESLGQPTRTRNERSIAAPGRLLSQVRMVQSIQAHDGVMWVLRSSADSSMVATGGQDGVVRVWRVLSGDHGPSAAPSSSKAKQQLEKSATNVPSKVDRSFVEADEHSGSKVFANSRQMRSSRGFTSSDYVEGAEFDFESGGMHDPSIVGAFRDGTPVLHPFPIATFTGHTSDVLDVSWSAGSFLLSASLDCTVRLWHVHVAAHGEQRQLPGSDSKLTPMMAALVEEEQTVCMQGFPHPDLVTCVAFHPHSTRRFASGCVDGRVRIWGVGPREGCVLASAVIQHDMVTALSWSTDGNRLCAGTLHGKCRHYAWVPSTPSPTPSVLTASGPAPTSGHGGVSMHPSGARLDYIGNIDVKDRHANASAPGKKVTGLVTIPNGGGLVVASNDSRLRLYHRYTLVCKYKGLKNKHTMVRPFVTEKGEFVMCGSDDGAVYIWDRLLQMDGPQKVDSMAQSSYSKQTSTPRVFHKNPHFECFHTDEEQLTCVLALPPSAWRMPPEEASIMLRQRMQQAYNAQMQPLSHRVDTRNRRQTDSGVMTSIMALNPATHVNTAALQASQRIQAQQALHSPLLGALFLVGGFQGRLKVYENL